MKKGNEGREDRSGRKQLGVDKRGREREEKKKRRGKDWGEGGKQCFIESGWTNSV